MIELLASSFLVMLASLAGVLAVWNRVGVYIEKNLDLLVSFSAGVFLVFAYQVGGEAIEHSASTTVGVAWILGGAVAIWLVFKFTPDSHSHDHGGHGHTHLDARRLLVTDGIHNAADGVFLAASYAVSVPLGIAATVGILAHEVLQEISEFFVLRDAGYSIKKALTVNFFVSSTILIGALGGYFLLDMFEMLEGPLLSLVAGGIIVVVLHDLIPHSVREAVSMRHYLQHLVWFSVGVLLMLGISALIPHTEPVDELESLPLAQSL